MIWKYLRLASTWCASLLLPALCCGQSWEKFSEGVISCVDRTAIISTPGSGISYVFLDSGRRKWRVMNNNTPQVGPVVAGDTVAVIADAFNTIYAFSKTTGKTVWTKHIWANRLASDGSYFYVVRTAYWDLEALDPASGNIAWSLQLPDLGPGYLPFLIVHDGLLFTVNLVIDISRKAIVHQWPRKSYLTGLPSGITAVSFSLAHRELEA